MKQQYRGGLLMLVALVSSQMKNEKTDRNIEPRKEADNERLQTRIQRRANRWKR